MIEAKYTDEQGRTKHQFLAEDVWVRRKAAVIAGGGSVQLERTAPQDLADLSSELVRLAYAEEDVMDLTDAQIELLALVSEKDAILDLLAYARGQGWIT